MAIMVKMHGRAKRNHGLTAGHSHRKSVSGATKTKGARTFGSKEAAEKYAKANKLAGAIVPAKKGKRFKIEA